MPESPTTTSSAEAPTHLVEGGSSFIWNGYMYRVLQPGQDFLDEDGFSSHAETVARIQASGKPVVLSLGESTTSGWDTTITPENRRRKAEGLAPISAFFRYRNFTDMLRLQIGEQYEVINAGVPGYTILSGLRRMKLLAQRFRAANITVRYVLINFGHNDCLWENNFQDHYHLYLHRRSPALLERARRLLHPIRRDKLLPRMSARHFGRYNRKLIALVRSMGAEPILVQPEVTLYWEPGKRYVDLDFEELSRRPGGAAAVSGVQQAKALWQSVIDQPYSEHKIATLRKATELDYILPRIKQSHTQVLQQTAQRCGVPLVETAIPRDEDEQRYFVDYAHTRENINAEIARNIATHIKS